MMGRKEFEELYSETFTSLVKAKFFCRLNKVRPLAVVVVWYEKE